MGDGSQESLPCDFNWKEILPSQLATQPGFSRVEEPGEGGQEDIYPQCS